MPYPKINLTINGHYRPVELHKIVCETWNVKPRPKKIPKSVWNKTPKLVRDFITSSNYYIVHHKDHNKQNYNPKNLMWTTIEGNNHFSLQHHGNPFSKNSS